MHSLSVCSNRRMSHPFTQTSIELYLISLDLTLKPYGGTPYLDICQCSVELLDSYSNLNLKPPHRGFGLLFRAEPRRHRLDLIICIPLLDSFKVQMIPLKE
jgi:hypothetical protein